MSKKKTAFWAGMVAFSAAVSGQPKLPNIVLVMADDLGKGDLSFYHRQRTGEETAPVPTPNLDRLIESGMRFSDAHAPAALCAPTRYSMLTGNYPYRNGKPDGVWTAHGDPQIDPDCTTIARIAKAGGYHTAFFGKWGLGGSWKWRPTKAEDFAKLTMGALNFGFDYALELPEGIQGAPYAIYENRELYKLKPDSKIAHVSIAQTRYDLVLDAKAKNRDGFGDLNWDPKLIGPLMVEKATGFIKNHMANRSGEPFFMYYCSQAVHTPHAAADELDGEKVAGKTAGPLGDFIYELDVQVGALLKALKETGAYENTLFIFTSDNGGLPGRWDQAIFQLGHRSNGNLSGQKGSIEEGGHRIPFVAVWPGKIKPNSECHEPMSGLDVVATLATLTGCDIDRAVVKDSVNLLPLLVGGETPYKHRYLIHQNGGIQSFAIRDGKWKLTVNGNVRNLPKPKLYTFDRANFKPMTFYDLSTNLNENPKHNLINHPEYKERAKALFEKFCELRTGAMTVVDH